MSSGTPRRHERNGKTRTVHVALCQVAQIRNVDIDGLTLIADQVDSSLHGLDADDDGSDLLVLRMNFKNEEYIMIDNN